MPHEIMFCEKVFGIFKKYTKWIFNKKSIIIIVAWTLTQL
jgi:hypothetical protein